MLSRLHSQHAYHDGCIKFGMLVCTQVPVSITEMPQTFVPLLNCKCKPNDKPAYKPPSVKGQGGKGGNGGSVHQNSKTNQSGYNNSGETVCLRLLPVLRMVLVSHLFVYRS